MKHCHAIATKKLLLKSHANLFPCLLSFRFLPLQAWTSKLTQEHESATRKKDTCARAQMCYYERWYMRNSKIVLLRTVINCSGFEATKNVEHLFFIECHNTQISVFSSLFLFWLHVLWWGEPIFLLLSVDLVHLAVCVKLSRGRYYREKEA